MWWAPLRLLVYALLHMLDKATQEPPAIKRVKQMHHEELATLLPSPLQKLAPFTQINTGTAKDIEWQIGAA